VGAARARPGAAWVPLGAARVPGPGGGGWWSHPELGVDSTGSRWRSQYIADRPQIATVRTWSVPCPGVVRATGRPHPGRGPDGRVAAGAPGGQGPLVAQVSGMLCAEWNRLSGS
jgi:hypothetical protein